MFDGGLHDTIEADLQNDGSYLFRRIVETSPWQKFYLMNRTRQQS